MSASRKHQHKKTWIERVFRLVLRQCSSPDRLIAWFEAVEGSIFRALGPSFLICILLPFVHFALYDNSRVLLISAVALFVFPLTRLDRHPPTDRNRSHESQPREMRTPNPLRWLRIVIPLTVVAIVPLAKGEIGKRVAQFLGLKINPVESPRPSEVRTREQSAPAPVTQRRSRGRITVPAPEAAPASTLESELSRRKKFLEERARSTPPTAAPSDEHPRQKKAPTKQKTLKPKSQQQADKSRAADGEAKNADDSSSGISRE